MNRALTSIAIVAVLAVAVACASGDHPTPDGGEARHEERAQPHADDDVDGRPSEPSHAEQHNAEQPVAGARADSSDWCGGHGLPESMCTRCNPELAEQFQATGDWCAEHGFPESACPTCNPMHPPGESAAAAGWCVEHGLPESACTQCNPELAERFQADGDWCDEHAFPESVCPICNPQRAPVGATVGGPVHLPPEAIARSDLRIRPAESAGATRSVAVPAEVRLNPDRVAHVNTLVPGQLLGIEATLGDRVEAGQVLAELRSVELGQARAALSRANAMLDVAEQNRDRQRRLRDEGISSERSVLEAELAYQEADAERDAARSRLRVLGVSGGRGAEMRIESPIAGQIVERHATRGENVTPDDTLFVVADLSRVWVIGRVYEQDVAQLSPGMSATLEVNAFPGRTWSGTVDFINATVDEDTRSLPIRVELDNADGALRPGFFGSLHLTTGGSPGPVTSVPADAVQTVNGQPVVFVPGQADGEFLARAVSIGAYHAGRAEVLDGLRSAERVVVSDAFLLKSELMRHALGEGCAHH